MQFVPLVCVYLFELIFTKDLIVFLIVYIYDMYCKMLAMKLILTDNLARKPIPIFPNLEKVQFHLHIRKMKIKLWWKILINIMMQKKNIYILFYINKLKSIMYVFFIWIKFLFSNFILLYNIFYFNVVILAFQKKEKDPKQLFEKAL